MKNQPLRTFGVAALLAQSLILFACSSSTPSGSGGAAGTTSGQGGNLGGGQGGGGGTAPAYPGSCVPGQMNPDYDGTGACSPTCQSVGCGLPCHQDCCVPCGIDSSGTKFCACPTVNSPFSNCTCSPPPSFPAGLTGGACSPQGYAATMVPPGAPAGAISLKGVPCTKVNTVCFTQESSAASERGCICMADGVMHCGSVNKWFTNNLSAATPYN